VKPGGRGGGIGGEGWRRGGDVGGVLIVLRWMLVFGEFGVTAGWACVGCFSV